MENIGLKPCPFCGGKAEIKCSEFFGVECTACYSRTNGYATEEKAIEAWNKRYIDIFPKSIMSFAKFGAQVLDMELVDYLAYSVGLTAMLSLQAKMGRLPTEDLKQLENMWKSRMKGVFRGGPKNDPV